MTNIDKTEKIYKTFLTELILTKNYGFNICKSYDRSKECDICMESLYNGLILNMQCPHIFHYKCIMECIVTYEIYNCPVCGEKYNFLGDNINKMNNALVLFQENIDTSDTDDKLSIIDVMTFDSKSDSSSSIDNHNYDNFDNFDQWRHT